MHLLEDKNFAHTGLLNRGEINGETTIRVVRNQLCVYYTYDKQGSNTPAAAGWVDAKERHRKALRALYQASRYHLPTGT